MGKVKIGLNCYLTADILTTVLQKCSMSSFLPNISFLSTSLNLVVKFAKRKIEKHLLRSHKGTKLKLCRTLHLASTKCMFLLPLLMYFRCYINLMFPLTYNGKSDIAISLQIFWQTFSEMFIEWSSKCIILFLLQFDWLSWQLKG